MSNKDLVKPVLEGIVTDATNSLINKPLQTLPTSTNIPPSLAETSTATTTTTKTKMSEEETLIQQLQEEKKGTSRPDRWNTGKKGNKYWETNIP